MRKFFNTIDKFVDRAGYWYGAWVLFGSSGIGFISAWLSTGVDAISQYGRFGWWSAGLAGAVAFSIIALFAAVVRVLWSNASAQSSWAKSVDHFNPTMKDFQKLRMEIRDLAHPITKRISGKRLYDCELIGPSNLFFHEDIHIQGTGFIDCTFVVLWPNLEQKVFPGNAIVLENTEIHGGQICGATIMLKPNLVSTFSELGAKFSTLTGDQHVDNGLMPLHEVKTPL